MVFQSYQRSFMPKDPAWDVQTELALLHEAPIPPPMRIKERIVRIGDDAPGTLLYTGGQASLLIDAPIRPQPVRLDESRTGARDLFTQISGKAIEATAIKSHDLSGWRLRLHILNEQRGRIDEVAATLESPPSGALTICSHLDSRQLRDNFGPLYHASQQPTRTYLRYCTNYGGRPWLIEKDQTENRPTTCIALMDGPQDKIATHEMPPWVGKEITHKPSIRRFQNDFKP